MIRSIQLGPYTFFADDASRPGLEILENSFNYEKHVVAELRRLVPGATGFLDLGANCGIHTVIAKTIRPDLPIVAAECSPFNLSLLCRNILQNKLSGVTVLPFPISNCPCILRTNEHEANMCCSFDGLPDSENYPRLAPSLPLDLLHLPPISLIKADIEGFELIALEGASKIMASRPSIIFEFCPEITHRSGRTPVQFLEWFTGRGYRLTVLDYTGTNQRKTCASAAEALEHVLATSKWIGDLLAEPQG